MEAFKIYLTRMTTVRDNMKSLISQDSLPFKLEQQGHNFLIQINREIERVKRAIAALSEATPLPPSGGSDHDGEPVTDDQLPLIDETVHKKKTAKS